MNENMKKVLKSLILKSRVLKLAKHSRKGRLFVFNYHRIRESNKNILFDRGVYGPNINRFKQEMRWIKKETRVLSEPELIEILSHNRPLTENCSLVTFDDGYRDSFELAFPILHSLKMPASFFIPTWHLTERKLGWWDIVAYLIKQSKKDSFTFREEEICLSKGLFLINKLIGQIKEMETTRINGFITSLSEATGVPMPSAEVQSKELMTWDQIRELKKNGMSIGSHSHNHIILSKENIFDLRTELKTSKEILEKELQCEVNSIAYPVGGYSHFDIETKNITKELGFKIGYSYLTGINYFGKIDPFDVKRIGIQPQWPNLDYLLAFPERAFPSPRTPG